MSQTTSIVRAAYRICRTLVLALIAAAGLPASAEPIPLVPGETQSFTIGQQETIEFVYTISSAFAQATLTLGLGQDVAACDGFDLPVHISAAISSQDLGPLTTVLSGVYSVTAPADTYSIVVGWDQAQLDAVLKSGCAPPSTLTFQILLNIRPIADGLEPDDSPDDARWLGANGEGQVHRLSDEDDEDWMTFVDPGNTSIIVRARSLVSTLDAALELYASDGQTLLASATDEGSNTIEIDYDNPLDQEALFFIRLFSASKEKGGGGVFVVEAQSSGGGLLAALAGTVTEDATGDPIEGAEVIVETLGNASALTNGDGIYTFNGLPQGNVTATAQAGGFTSVSTGIALGAGINQADFFLGEGGGSTGCFIATAAYGTPLAPEVNVLRQFRDDYLLTNPVGAALTDTYYTISPPLADIIASHPILAGIARTMISLCIACTEFGFLKLGILAAIGAVAGVVIKGARRPNTFVR